MKGDTEHTGHCCTNLRCNFSWYPQQLLVVDEVAVVIEVKPKDTSLSSCYLRVAHVYYEKDARNIENMIRSN